MNCFRDCQRCESRSLPILRPSSQTTRPCSSLFTMCIFCFQELIYDSSSLSSADNRPKSSIWLVAQRLKVISHLSSTTFCPRPFFDSAHNPSLSTCLSDSQHLSMATTKLLQPRYDRPPVYVWTSDDFDNLAQHITSHFHAIGKSSFSVHYRKPLLKGLGGANVSLKVHAFRVPSPARSRWTDFLPLFSRRFPGPDIDQTKAGERTWAVYSSHYLLCGSLFKLL